MVVRDIYIKSFVSSTKYIILFIFCINKIFWFVNNAFVKAQNLTVEAVFAHDMQSTLHKFLRTNSNAERMENVCELINHGVDLHGE